MSDQTDIGVRGLCVTQRRRMNPAAFGVKQPATVQRNAALRFGRRLVEQVQE